MAASRAYLDWNATAPMSDAAKAAVVAAMAVIGNPSSIHGEGRAARKIIEDARAEVAALVAGEAENVFFTSGATEAINAVFAAGLSGCCGKEIASAMVPVVSATEHSAVHAAAGPGVRVIPVDGNGLVDAEALKALLSETGPALVAIQLANNESGVVQDIPTLAAIVHAAGGALMVDAVQAPGRLALDITALGADALILTAHKFAGPKGIGAIIFPDSKTRLASALLKGGGQERGQRGGTENLIGIAGLGAAAKGARAALADVEKVIHLRDEFENHLRRFSNDLQIVGAEAPRLPNTSLFAVSGLTSDRALIAFDLDGVAVSAGSACSSGKVKASHVLNALGVPDWVKAGAIRVSLGPTTEWADLERCLSSLERQMARKGKAA